MVRKIYCAICGKYRKFKNLKISYIFEKTLALYSIEMIKNFDLIKRKRKQKKRKRKHKSRIYIKRNR